jgi:hypothetical protein
MKVAQELNQRANLFFFKRIGSKVGEADLFFGCTQALGRTFQLFKELVEARLLDALTVDYVDHNQIPCNAILSFWR